MGFPIFDGHSKKKNNHRITRPDIVVIAGEQNKIIDLGQMRCLQL